MPSNPKSAKTPYSGPSFRIFDARAAQAELKAKGDRKDPNVQKMLSFTDRQLPRSTPAPNPDEGFPMESEWFLDKPERGK